MSLGLSLLITSPAAALRAISIPVFSAQVVFKFDLASTTFSTNFVLVPLDLNEIPISKITSLNNNI